MKRVKYKVIFFIFNTYYKLAIKEGLKDMTLFLLATLH